jgi:hypothetical protein
MDSRSERKVYNDISYHESSPSMTANTPQDFELKCNLLDDAFTIIDMEKMYKLLNPFKDKTNWSRRASWRI